jgi:2,3-bisphosphoglycerate-independent phosphoglycerate mutase
MAEEKTTSLPLSDAVLVKYKNGEEDEAMMPVLLEDAAGAPVGRMSDGDYVIFYDIRGEREIQLTECLTDPAFKHFDTKGLTTRFVTMIEYDRKLDAKVAFEPPTELKNTLVAVVSQAGKKTLKLVETEKAVHLGHFLNGKREEPFPGEERRFTHSLKVDDFSQHPRMSIAEVCDSVVSALEDENHDLICANFANTDVIGHIENRDALIAAIEAVDENIGVVVAAARKAGREVVITADHGSAEKWYYPDGKVDTGHTDSLVPLIYLGDGLVDGAAPVLRGGGSLIDVAPTVLEVMGLDRPDEMTGRSLFGDGSGKLRNEKGGRKVLLLIADGWGYNESEEGNLIAAANTPNMDRYLAESPFTALEAAGEAVGMPAGTVGNSEAGHLHIGTGRVIYSDRLRIDRSLDDGSFYKNPAFLWAMESARDGNQPLHLLGIVSFYSSHGSLHHLYGLIKMAREVGVKEVYIHSLLGRRGERPEAGAAYIRDVEKEAARMGVGQVVTVLGRHWALDREYNWDRIEKTYRALVDGVGEKARGE